MSDPDRTEADRKVVADYLDEAARRLPGRGRDRSRVLEELEDGLCETLRAHRCSSAATVEVAEAAVAEFGEPALVAAAYAPELRTRQVRRSAGWTLALLLSAGATWQGYHHSVGDLRSTVPTTAWAEAIFNALTATMPILPVVAQLVAVALLGVTLTTVPARRGSRALLRALTGALAVAMSLTVLNAVAILALMSGSLPLMSRWIAPLVLLAFMAAALTHSFLAASQAARVGVASEPSAS